MARYIVAPSRERSRNVLLAQAAIVLTGDTVVGDFQIGFEVALTAVRRPVEVWAGDYDATAATPRAPAGSQVLHVGEAIRPVVGASYAASWPSDSTTIARFVDDEDRVGRTGGIEVLPLTDFV